MPSITLLGNDTSNPHTCPLTLQRQYRHGCWIHSVQNLFGGVPCFDGISVEYKIITPLLGCRIISRFKNINDYSVAALNEDDVALDSRNTFSYTTYKVQIGKGSFTKLSTMINECTGKLLLNGIDDIFFCVFLNALNDPKSAKGIYLGRRNLGRTITTMEELVVESLQKNCANANAAILYYGYTNLQEGVAFGHYVAIWHYDGENNLDNARWCYYDSFDTRVYFGKTLEDLDKELSDAQKKTLR